MSQNASSPDYLIVDSEAWKKMRALQKQLEEYHTAVDRIPYFSAAATPQGDECPPVCNVLLDVKSALNQMADVSIAIRDALQAQGNCCQIPLNFSDAAGGEEITPLRGHKCSALLPDGADFADLDVCRSLEVLRDWLLNCSKMLC